MSTQKQDWEQTVLSPERLEDLRQNTLKADPHLHALIRAFPPMCLVTWTDDLEGVAPALVAGFSCNKDTFEFELLVALKGLAVIFPIPAAHLKVFAYLGAVTPELVRQWLQQDIN